MKKSPTGKQQAILATAAITLALLLLIPSVTSTLAANDAPKDDLKGYSENAKVKQKEIDDALAKHSDWIGMLSWNSTTATIDYLGPAEENPYNAGPEAYLAPAVTVQKASAPNTLSGTSGTAIYRIEENFYNKYSTSTSVDYRQVLNAMSSDKKRWLQVGMVYDSQSLWGTPSWRLLYNSWFTTGANEKAITSSPVTTGPSSPIELYIRADSATAGKYRLGFFDSVYLSGASLSWTFGGDTGKNINIGTVSNIYGTFPSGSMVEEYSKTGTAKYNFGTQTFSLAFLKTSTSSETTAVSGFTVAGFGSCASATNVNSPASTSYRYTC